MFNDDNRDNWSEIQWEMEIRRDERRISRYFRELSNCIDLPGEEELIFNKLASHPDLIPKGVSADEMRFRNRFDDEDEESAEQESSIIQGDYVQLVDHLAVSWAIACAAENNEDAYLAGIGVSCCFSKLMSRIIDFNDAGEDDVRNLRQSLGRRIICDIDETLVKLRGCAESDCTYSGCAIKCAIMLAKLARQISGVLTE
jgi:hypothetical protein